MAEYHVGSGFAGIYAGTLKKNGEEWNNKSDVTNEALCAAAQYLLFGGKEFRFEHMGEWYVMRIEELERSEEPKKCDTCKHVKSQWFNRCADCSDYELWESKE